MSPPPGQPSGREAEVHAIAQSTLGPSKWSQLEAPERHRVLLAFWNFLRNLPPRLVHAMASGQPEAPKLAWSPQQGILFQNEQSRLPEWGRPGHLEGVVARANANGYLVHGFDARGNPVLTAMRHLNRHMDIQGVSGTGKSSYGGGLLAQLATQDGPIVVVAPHDELLRELIPRLPKKRLKDVVYIDPADPLRTWGTNFMQMARTLVDETGPDFVQTSNRVIEDSVNAIVHALSVIQEDTSGYSSGPSVQSMLRMGALAATEREDTSFVDLYNLLTNPDIRSIAVEEVARSHVAEYFRIIYPRLNVEYIERVRNKLDPFLQSAMVNLFSRREECISLRDMIEGDKIVLFDLDTQRLPPSISSLIGYIVITMVMFVVEQRPRKKGLKPLYLFVDEFANVASKSTVRWLAQARKMNAGLIVDYQHLSQLPEEVQQALGNAGIKAMFRTTPDDARLLAPALGFVDEFGRPQPTELSELADFQMHLVCITEQEDPSNAARQVITTRTLPPPDLAARDAALVNRIREVSRRKYALPNDAQDHQTIYTAEDAGSRQVLEAIHEASLAVRRGRRYQVSSKDARVWWALDHGHVTFALITAILEAKGLHLTPKRVGQLRRTLAVRGLVRMRRTTEGLETTDLTPAGQATVRRYILPGTARQEGGPLHKEGVLRLYDALCALAPVNLVVPDQASEQYTPDLIALLRHREEGRHWLHRVTPREVIHFHFEQATRRKPQKIAANIERAQGEGAQPIIVVAEDGDFAGPTLASLYWAVQSQRDAMNGKPGPTLPGPRGVPEWRLWVLTRAKGLLEFDPVLQGTKAIETTYLEATGEGSAGAAPAA